VSQSVISGLYSHSFRRGFRRDQPGALPGGDLFHGFAVSRKGQHGKIRGTGQSRVRGGRDDHADALATAFPDGRVLTSTISGLSPELFTNNVKDVEFVLAELTRMNQSDPVFQNTMDLRRVGTMGWSYGGGVRRKSAARMSGARRGPPGRVFCKTRSGHRLRVGKPFLRHVQRRRGRHEGAFPRCTHDAYWMQIKGTQHQHCADWLAWISSPTRRAGEPPWL